jgi:hypothetical protein
MSRVKELHDRISGTALCDLLLLESERAEVLRAYDARRLKGPYPPMSLQIFAHNVRENACVTVYWSHLAELLRFARESGPEWLEEQLIAANNAANKARLKAKEATPGQ